jgi:hypothetical protein
VKGNVTPNATIKRAPGPLNVFLFAILIGGYIWGCSSKPAVIPEELIGKYTTTHPEYEDQFFELGSGLITLAFGDGKYKYYSVKRVEKEIIDDRLLYTILCSNEDEEEEFNFAFFADLENGRVIRFKNKQHVSWEKQESKISYKDHSNTQIQH